MSWKFFFSMSKFCLFERVVSESWTGLQKGDVLKWSFFKCLCTLLNRFDWSRMTCLNTESSIISHQLYHWLLRIRFKYFWTRNVVAKCRLIVHVLAHFVTVMNFKIILLANLFLILIPTSTETIRNLYVWKATNSAVQECQSLLLIFNCIFEILGIRFEHSSDF